jgi:hypothetical protein
MNPFDTDLDRSAAIQRAALEKRIREMAGEKKA